VLAAANQTCTEAWRRWVTDADRFAGDHRRPAL